MRRFRGSLRAAFFSGSLLILTSHSIRSVEIEQVYPPVWNGDRPQKVQFRGSSLEDVQLWSSFPCEAVCDSGSDSESTWTVKPLMKTPGIGMIRLRGSGTASDWTPILVDDTPFGEAPNGWIETWPAIVYGKCESLKMAEFRFSMRRNQEASIQLFATRIGSRLDPVLIIKDPSGRELSHFDDSHPNHGDPEIRFKASQTGMHTIQIKDLNFEGGPRHFFLLKLDRAMKQFPLLTDLVPEKALPFVREIEPNSNQNQAQNVAVPSRLSGGFDQTNDVDWFRLEVKSRRVLIVGASRSIGSPANLWLRLVNSEGVKIVDASPALPLEIVLSAPIPAEAVFLRVEELNGLGGPGFDYALDLLPTDQRFDMTTDQSRLRMGESGEFSLTGTVVRRNFEGMIQLTAVPEGVVDFSQSTIAEKATNWTVKGNVKNEKSGPVFIQIIGKAALRDMSYQSAVSTLPALKRKFPQLLYPYPQLDGLIALPRTSGKRDQVSPDP